MKIFKPSKIEYMTIINDLKTQGFTYYYINNQKYFIKQNNVNGYLTCNKCLKNMANNLGITYTCAILDRWGI